MTKHNPVDDVSSLVQNYQQGAVVQSRLALDKSRISNNSMYR